MAKTTKKRTPPRQPASVEERSQRQQLGELRRRSRLARAIAAASRALDRDIHRSDKALAALLFTLAETGNVVTVERNLYDADQRELRELRDAVGTLRAEVTELRRDGAAATA